MYPLILHHKEVMVARTSIISESEVSNTVLCLPRFIAVRNKNCLKSTSVITVASMKNMMAPVIV